MATISEVGLNWHNQAGTSGTGSVPLDSLPFPAALVDQNGVIAEINADWAAAHPTFPVGRSALNWVKELYAGAPGFRSALLGGLHRILTGAERRFLLDCVTPGSARRVAVTAVAGGGLLTDQELGGAYAETTPTRDVAEHRRSQKMETVGRLVSGVAHDFANLLTLIAGYGDILLNRTRSDDPLRAEIEEIRRAASRGARLTSQLLGFSRGESVRPRPLDLNSLVRDVERMLRPIIGEHLEVVTALQPGIGKIIADPGQMEQVIMNLLLNARDAMPGGGRIRIETRAVTFDESTASKHGMAAGPCVLLSVSDTGHGIDPEALEHIFEPFFTTKERGKGTGLGLSTVLSIVRERGGDVWAHSTLGEGATFMLCMPAGGATAEEGDAPSPERGAGAGNETVLLVEDEDGVRRLLAHILNRRGYRVLEAPNGQDALRLFESNPAIRLVLTDMLMPRMSGRELAEHVRKLRPGIPVIFMSGYTDDVLVRTGALGPGMSFLQKPLGPDLLAAKVREALDSASRPFNPR